MRGCRPLWIYIGELIDSWPMAKGEQGREVILQKFYPVSLRPQVHPLFFCIPNWKSSSCCHFNSYYELITRKKVFLSFLCSDSYMKWHRHKVCLQDPWRSDRFSNPFMYLGFPSPYPVTYQNPEITYSVSEGVFPYGPVQKVPRSAHSWGVEI